MHRPAREAAPVHDRWSKAMSTINNMCHLFLNRTGRSLAVACVLTAVGASVASGQVVVDGREHGVTIQARPVQRTYAQVYSAPNRARLITKASVMDNGGTIPPVQNSAYVQPNYGQVEVVAGRAMGGSDEFRLDPYANRRYLNYSYYDNVYYGNWYGGRYGYYSNWYSYQYYPGFYYYWRPSFSNYSFNYRRGGYSCGPRYYGGSHYSRGSRYSGGSSIRFNSSCGLSVHLRF